jgi:8-oxo-dGTP pyrophosphatase MutT (NUDIX family)
VESMSQTSSGGVVFRDEGKLEICLINPTGRTVWALPKGGIEAGERRETAALREIREETGIEGRIIASLGSIDYWFYSREGQRRVHKTVHFFVVEATGGDTACHDHEVSEARWFSARHALDRMTYLNEREVVRKATALLQKERAGRRRTERRPS